MNKKCQFCNCEAEETYRDYVSKQINKTTQKPIVVKDVITLKCTNTYCEHTWLPIEEERRIDREIVYQAGDL